MVIIKVLLLDRNEILQGYIQEINTFEPLHSFNGEDILEFTTTDTVAIEKGFRVLYQDKNKTWYEYIIKGIEESKIGSKVEKRVFCENSFYETLGDFIEDVRPSGNAEIALKRALEASRWEVGLVEVFTKASTMFYRTSVREAVEQVVEIWGGELRTRIDVTENKVARRSVDLLKRRGKNSKRRFTYSNGLKSAERIVHRDDIITALYGFGKGEETEEGYGRRVNFSSINDGKMYLENNEARKLWGRLNNKNQKEHIFGKVEFTEIEDIKELKEETQKELDEMSKIKISYEIELEALTSQGFKEKDISLGDNIVVIDKDFNPELRIEARITQLEPRPLDENSYKLILGNFENDIINEFENTDDYLDKAVNTIYSDIGKVQAHANKKNRIFRGITKPVTGVVKGDLWYKPTGEGETELYIHDGESWGEPEVAAGMNKEIKKQLKEAKDLATDAKSSATNASNRVQTAIENSETAYNYADSAIKISKTKNTVYRGIKMPDEGTLNDIWYKRTTDIVDGKEVELSQLHLHDGTTFVKKADDASGLGGTLNLANLNVLNMTADLISAGKLKLDRGIQIWNNEKLILGASQGQVLMDVDNLLINSKTIDSVIGTQIYQDNFDVGLKYTGEDGETKSLINIGADGPYLSGDSIVLDADTVVDGSFTVTDTIFAENMDISKFTGGILNFAEVNGININAQNIVGENADFVRASFNADNSNLNLDGTGLDITRNDGKWSSRLDEGSFKMLKEGEVVGELLSVKFELPDGQSYPTIPSKGAAIKIPIGGAFTIGSDKPGFFDGKIVSSMTFAEDGKVFFNNIFPSPTDPQSGLRMFSNGRDGTPKDMRAVRLGYIGDNVAVPSYGLSFYEKYNGVAIKPSSKFSTSNLYTDQDSDYGLNFYQSSIGSVKGIILNFTRNNDSGIFLGEDGSVHIATGGGYYKKFT